MSRNIMMGLETAQLEADRRLLNFSSYEEYLDSLTTDLDKFFLQSLEVSRTIAELGYRCAGDTLSKERYEKKVAAVLNYLHPPHTPYELFSDEFTEGDEFQAELALRERSNRVGILSTIIFVRFYMKSGSEISGYMDYAERLTTKDWRSFFKGIERIEPTPSDLGYYNWRRRKVVSNHSLNYKVMQHPIDGLLFRNRFDRRIINPAPDARTGHNTKRKRCASTMYNLAIIFDHVVRQRI